MAATWSKDDIGRKWDRCFADTLLKLSCGITIGGIVSLFFFRRRMWPVIIGAGFGLGTAYSECEREINTFSNQYELESKCEGKKK
ncbi:MICOS complex subunit Mic10-like [Vespa mandarinia]|uniref:MICOS complex subunit Mic10-like n=1 Tax=Vespa mandarinia TaxID=7446 RepID=UPI00161B63B7|nr:MICOS complex subunit Mic10-like [Vespa mandarinia]XP_035732682.1 MICOS complex subunit Mic10-like [Vespa mandarinia]XP_035732683.1 MICOS complex subunit Mic10-like [Vespa mandarinia]XP_046823309.1 MICOS complex subunit Mic10-like [Vespa crabro]